MVHQVSEKKENKFLKFFEDLDKGFKDFFGIPPKTGTGASDVVSQGEGTNLEETAPSKAVVEAKKPVAADLNAFTSQVGNFFQKLKDDSDTRIADWKAKQEADKEERKRKTKEFFDNAKKSWDDTVQKWQDDWKKAGENIEADIDRRKAKMRDDWQNWVNDTREDYKQFLKYQSRVTARTMLNIMLVIIPIILVVAIVLALVSKFTNII